MHIFDVSPFQKIKSEILISLISPVNPTMFACFPFVLCQIPKVEENNFVVAMADDESVSVLNVADDADEREIPFFDQDAELNNKVIFLFFVLHKIYAKS